jgi:hypothetical protein
VRIEPPPKSGISDAPSPDHLSNPEGDRMTMQKPKETVGENRPKTRDRTINVEGMKGDSSVSKITEALKTVKNLSVDAVKDGTLKLRAATRDEAKAACAAIKTAGFESREAPRPETATS